MTYNKEEYELNKVGHIRRQNNWIARHRDEHNANMRVVMKRHYENNKEKIGEYKRLRYLWKKEVSRLMSMYTVYE